MLLDFPAPTCCKQTSPSGSQFPAPWSVGYRMEDIESVLEKPTFWFGKWLNHQELSQGSLKPCIKCWVSLIHALNSQRGDISMRLGRSGFWVGNLHKRTERRKWFEKLPLATLGLKSLCRSGTEYTLSAFGPCLAQRRCSQITPLT